MENTHGTTNRRKVKPVPLDLPPYMRNRDQIAVRAGLQVEHYWHEFRYRSFATKYTGSFDCVKSSDFVIDKELFQVPISTRHCVKRGINVGWAAAGRDSAGAFRNTDSTCYIKVVTTLPDKWGTLDSGTQYFIFNDWDNTYCEKIVYRGTADAMLNDGIVSADNAVKLRESGSLYCQDQTRNHCYTLYEANRINDTEYEYTRYVANEEKCKLANQPCDLPIDADESAYRARVEKRLLLAEEDILDVLLCSTGRKIEYHHSAKVAAQVAERLMLIRVLLASDVVTKREQVAPKITSIPPPSHRADPAFQKFLSDLAPN